MSVARTVVRHLSRPVGTVRAVRTRQPHVVLTYDDGPDPRGTPGVLRALAGAGATATFFVLMRRARLYRSLLDDVAAAGHEIGLHGVDHRRLTTFPASEVYRRTRAGRSELEDLTGRSVRWFRAPYGALLPPHWLAVRRAGVMPVFWGPTPSDWRDLPEETLADEAMAGTGAGEIVLAHDGFAGPEDGADDGDEPPIDRGRLAELMLSRLDDRGLVGRSLADSLREGRTARWAVFIR